MLSGAALREVLHPASIGWATVRSAHRVGGWRLAAVLVAIVQRTEPTVLLTRRSALLRAHAGQVSFPGGHADDADGDVVSTALREASEEIGLAAGEVEVLGCLQGRRTRTSRHLLIPVVGLISPGIAWRIEAAEVEEVFELPFSVLLDETAPRLYTEGERKGACYWAGQDRDIWGATAAILVALAMAIRRAGCLPV